MARYVMFFSVVYVIAAVLESVVATVFKLGSTLTFSIAPALAGAFFAAARFVKTEDRLPEKVERSRFAWLAVAAMFILSSLVVLVYVGVLLPTNETRGLLRLWSSPISLGILLVAVAVLALIYYTAIRWGFGWYAKRAYAA